MSTLVADRIEDSTTNKREQEILIVQRWKWYPYWTFYYKFEKSSDFITTKVILLLKLNTLLKNWENLRFQYYSYYKTERTSDFITKKVILQLKLNISLQNWENKRLSTKGILQLKLNILLQNWEIFRSRHYKGDVATQTEHFATKLRDLEIS